MKGKILVTGASGFIGRRLVRRLLQSGADVRCLLRPAAPVHAALRGAEIARGDLLDRASLAAAARGARAVVHCAALVRPQWAVVTRGRLEREYFAVNAGGTLNAARAAEEAGAGLFLHLSSIAAQGPGVSLRESDPCRPLTLYGRSKLASEEAALKGVPPGSGCRLVIARPAMIYGADSPSWGRFFSAVRGGLVPLPGRGHNTLSVCWAENLVDALLLLAEKGEDRGVYAVSEGPRSWEEMALLSAAALGVKPRLLRVPERPLGLLSAASAAALRAAGLVVPSVNYIAEPGSFREAVSSWGHDVSRLAGLGWTPRLDTRAALAAELAGGGV